MHVIADIYVDLPDIPCHLGMYIHYLVWLKLSRQAEQMRNRTALYLADGNRRRSGGVLVLVF